MALECQGESQEKSLSSFEELSPAREEDETKKYGNMSSRYWRDSLKFIFLILACVITFLGSVVMFPPQLKKDLSISESRYVARSAIPDGAAASFTPLPSQVSTSTSVTAAASIPTVLNVFQVAQPLLGPNGVIMGNGSANASTTSPTSGSSCQVTLMENTFSTSFGKPFVGDYTPPDCISSINTVIMNLTVTSNGTQFDRLAIMYLGDSEVFRTSTAEPRKNGIVWEYMNDVSHLMYFWKSPQKVIFDLPNQVTTNLTGAYTTTLTATFFKAKQAVVPADMIIPISTHQGVNASQPSVFTLPSQNATNTISNFPRNANRAIFSLSSTGQGNEEFWWSNSLQSSTSTFNSTAGALFGFSPFREVQLYIDNQLAGVQWPFPVIFTGGVTPGFWSPVVGIDAFDLKEDQIDISPFLPLLCDGKPHTFSINVVGLLDASPTDGTTYNGTLSQSVDTSWLVTGKIFLWLDSSESVTTGTTPSFTTPNPSISLTQTLAQNSTGANTTLLFSTSIHRTLTITSTISTSNTTSLIHTWTQTLSHTDTSTFLSSGLIQTNNILTSGTDAYIRGVENPYTNTYSYPLLVNSTQSTQGNGTLLLTSISRGKNTQVLGQGSLYPSGLQPFAILPQTADMVLTLAGTSLNTSQMGEATLFIVPGDMNSSFSFGTTNQMMRFGGKSAQGELGNEPDNELWFRSVVATNGTLVKDMMRLVGKNVVNMEIGNNSVLVEEGGMGMEDFVGRNFRGIGGGM